MASERTVLRLSGDRLEIDELVRAARDPRARLELDPDAMRRVVECRRAIDEAVASYERAYPQVEPAGLIYGVTTGFGEFKTIPIAPRDLITLQENILKSHATGIGDTPGELDSANYFPAEVVRATLIIRLNAFLRGNSGVRPELVLTLLAMFEAGIIPLVPTKGSVGSSGDLCPLAHLFVTLLGEGRFYEWAPGSTGIAASDAARAAWMIDGRLTRLRPAVELWACLRRAAEDNAKPAADAGPKPAADANLMRAAVDAVERRPVSYKEGLALTNGATFSTAVLALAAHDAEVLANTADAAAALTMEAMCSRVRFLDERVHQARGMIGQADSAANMRALIHGSGLCEWADPVQDSYSIRCAPAVHGASRDAIAYAKMVARAEINASTDNPLFFRGEAPFDMTIRGSRPEQRDKPVDLAAFSAGNFHGQPIAVGADVLAIAVAELANIAERRVQMMLDAAHNRNLPANLIAKPGVDSGFMISQYAAASLVSENKVLAHPASVDSIPTSANFEDHVAMATLAARKCRQVLENASAVLAIELMVGAQAVDWRTCLVDDDQAPMDAKHYYAIDPNVRSEAEQGLATDRLKAEARAGRRLERFSTLKPGRAGPGGELKPSARTAASLGRGSAAVYSAVRRGVPPMHRDQVIEPMIRELRLLIRSGEIVRAARQHGVELRPIRALGTPGVS